MQRINYSPACSRDEYLSRIPKTTWGTPMNNDYRLIARKMLNISGERTLIGAVVPPNTGHINGLITLLFKDVRILALIAGFISSVPYD